ncbi:MAG: hypothetical protein EOM68_15195, partial [Spirochaetia bacterium]|nr:hypothetical protein [Spirochaetia bacterium]
MNEQQRKTLELHELMGVHEWIPISQSFQVCKCGMCRGSESAYHRRKPRNNRRRRHAVNFTPTDWQTLSEVREVKNWFQAKMSWVDRVKPYLIEKPFWAGYYGKAEGNQELIERMKQDTELLYKHAIETKDFSEETEEQLRGDAEKLLRFLQTKRSHLNVDTIDISEESRQTLIINLEDYKLIQMAKLEGPKDDTRQKLIEGNGDYLYA